MLAICTALVGCKQAERSTTAVPDATVDRRGAISQCPIHNADLVDETLDASHMEVTYTAEYGEAMLKRFPHTGNPAVGINNPEIKKVLIRYCPECRKFNCAKAYRCPYYYEANPNNENYDNEEDE